MGPGSFGWTSLEKKPHSWDNVVWFEAAAGRWWCLRRGWSATRTSTRGLQFISVLFGPMTLFGITFTDDSKNFTGFFLQDSTEYIHLLSFIRNVYKERFLVLVKSIEIVRNGLVKSSKTIKLLRNGTSQKTFRKENFRVFPVFPPNFPEISWIVPNFFEFFRIFLNFPQMFLNHLLMYFIHI